MSIDKMTPYEQRAWRDFIEVLHAPPRRFLPTKVREGVAGAASAAAAKTGDLPLADSAKESVEKVFEGTLALTFRPALRSASPKSTVAKYAKKHPEVATLEDVQELPLKIRDQMLPTKTGYTMASAGQGGATALAVTGAEVATTVSAGATGGVVIAAVATDAVASLAMMGRTVGVVGSRYGYDPRLPEEELFAMGVLSVGLASSVGAKAQALAALSRLSQQMMRQATWAELQKHVLVKVTEKVYRQLGLRLTKRKLAQTVPVLGVGINAALSAQITEATFRRAQAVYRLRALSDTYGIDPSEWMNAATQGASEAASTPEPVVDVMAILDSEASEQSPKD